MDFTRQPIIETIITPREGCKLVVRNSKGLGQEEYFVDALELVSFGNALFYRSIEKPKAFLVPVSDYEVFEVREARIMLKNVGIEKTIKIGGGREMAKPPKETPTPSVEKSSPIPAEETVNSTVSEEGAELRLEKRKDRRRHSRRKKGKEEETRQEGSSSESSPPSSDANGLSDNTMENKEESKNGKTESPAAPFVSPLLPPPPLLISETMSRYKNNALFKGAFYSAEETEGFEETVDSEKEAIPFDEGSQTHPDDMLEALAMENVVLEPSSYSTLGPIEIEMDEASFSETESQIANQINGEQEESASGEIEPLDSPYFPFEPKP